MPSSSTRARSGCTAAAVAELTFESDAPTRVSVFADGRPLAPELVDGTATVSVDLDDEDWHAFVVRGAPGLRLASAAFR